MYKITEKVALNPTVTKMVIEAPLIAKKAKPGQFIIVRPFEDSERIPLTVAGYDREKGTVDIIFQIVGGTTMELNSLCCYFHSNLCCIQFSHCCLYAVGLLSSLSHCCTVNHHLSSFYLCCHISKLELCVLELTDCAAELLSLFYVSNCSVKGACIRCLQIL